MSKRVLPTLIFGLLIGAVAGHLYHSRPRSYLRDDVQWQFTEAAERSDINEMKRLHAAGAEIDGWPREKHTEGGFPAIVCAALYGRAGAIQWLIEQGADFNVVAATDTPLDCAEYHLREAQKAVDILKSHGAKHMGEQ